MDVIRLISELRSELAQMEREIRFLERFDAATTQAVAQLVAETGWVRDLDEMLVNCSRMFEKRRQPQDDGDDRTHFPARLLEFGPEQAWALWRPRKGVTYNCPSPLFGIGHALVFGAGSIREEVTA
jgi:hypothetical protein